MIQLYNPGNTDYTQNGDITLIPTMANIHVILNGAWSAELSHPIDDEGRWKYIQEEAVIKMPSFLPDDQLFRIKKATKSDSGVVAEMEPIFYDSMGDCWLDDIRPTGDSGQTTLNLMLSPNSKYSGSSNISKAATAYYQNVNFMEALNGDIQQSFINRWGGEILFNNYTVIVNTEAGGDYGVELRYGKNIPTNGMSEEVDTRDVVTRIYPKGYNGVMMSNNGYVDSPLINNYPTIKSATITFENIKMAADAQEGDEDNGSIICNSQSELDSQLTLACQQQFDNGIDKPKVTISADMVLLQNTEQYKDFAILENVSLGDTIHCINNHLDIVTDARVKELEYDSIGKKVSSVVIGDFEPGYFDGVTSNVNKIEAVVRPDGSLMAEKIQGILNGIWTQLRIQSNAAEKVEGRAFLVEDTDEDSSLYGAMCWGTQGLQIASQRTPDGRDWDWTTAITAQGIVANTIITGILSDKTGRNYWNLDTGEFRLSADAFQIDDQTAQDYIEGEIDNKIAQIRTLTVQLTNEFAGVPTNSEGGNGDYAECYTDVKVYIGTTDITESEVVTYTVNPSSGVIGNWDVENHRYTVTGMTTDTGNVSFTVTYSGLAMTKQFNIAKIKQGSQGVPGPANTYTWIKYADSPTSGMSDDPSGKSYLGLAYNKDTPTESDNYSDYEWSLIKGTDGLPGKPGENGQTLYTWIKYATSIDGDDMGDFPESQNLLNLPDYGPTTISGITVTIRNQMITYDATNATTTDYVNFNIGHITLPAGTYTISRNVENFGVGLIINDEDGYNIGIGVSNYGTEKTGPYEAADTDIILRFDPAISKPSTGSTPVKYMLNTGENGLTWEPYGITRDYIGIAYNKTTEVESNNPSDYTWSLIKGADGENGAPGRTYFLVVNPIVVSQSADGTYNPSGISVGSFYRDGDSAERSVYNGTLVFEESEDGTSFTKTGEYNFSQYGYTIQGEKIKAVRITMCVLNDTDSALDVQTVTIVRDTDNLTQEEIFNILTNNGETQGIFMQDGKLYINLSYAKAGTLSADYIKGGHISADLIQGGSISADLIQSGSMSADRLTGGTIRLGRKPGVDYGEIRIESPDGVEVGEWTTSGVTFGEINDAAVDFTHSYSNTSMSFYVNGRGCATINTEQGDGLKIYGNNRVDISSRGSIYLLSGTVFESAASFDSDVRFYEQAQFWVASKMYNLSHVTSGGHIVFAQDGQTLAYLASSSKKYKDHVRDLTDEEAEKLLNARVVWFKYKENYLNENDPMKGKEIPGFYAEEIEEIYPVLAQYNDKGEVEDWNYRTMIPLMMQLIKKQSKEIDDLKKSIEDLKSLISK